MQTNITIVHDGQQIKDIHSNNLKLNLHFVNTKSPNHSAEQLQVTVPEQSQLLQGRATITTYNSRSIKGTKENVPLIIASYGDINYVVDGSSILTSQYIDEVSYTTLKDIISDLNPERTICTVDIHSLLLREYRRTMQDNTLQTHDLQEEGTFLQELLATDPDLLIREINDFE